MTTRTVTPDVKMVAAKSQPRAPASVTDRRRKTFEAVVCELMPNSMLLRELPRALTFRERIWVKVLGYEVEGEVVFAGDGEAAVVFDTFPEVFEAIEAFEDFVHGVEAALQADDDGEDPTVHQPPLPEGPKTAESAPIEADPDLGGEAEATALAEPLEEALAAARSPTATIDIHPGFGGWDALLTVDEHGQVETKNDLERLSLLLWMRAGRPLVVNAASALSRSELRVGDLTVPLVAIPVGDQAYVLHPPAEAETVETAIRALRPVFDSLFPSLAPVVATPTAALPDPDDLPELQADGTVHFRSHAQFVHQAKINLINGAVMGRGTPLRRGTVMALLLVVPEADDLDIRNAEVAFSGDGKVGFSIPDVDQFRARIDARIAPGQTRKSTTEARPRRAPKPAFEFEATLTGLPDAQSIMQLRRGVTDDLGSARGWYIGIMDRVLRSGRDAQCRVEHDGDQVKIWVHDRRVVAVERTPPPEKDRLGERLISSRVIDVAALDDALDQAQRSRRPVGQVILASGLVSRAAVHRELRKQILDRLVVPCEWTVGEVRVSGWSDPPVNADLLPVNGDAVVTSLLRKQLQQTRLATLREQLAPLLSHQTNVDASKILESYRLTDREQRFFLRGADARCSLATLVSQERARPLEGYRLMLIGTALGFISIIPKR